MVSVPTNAGEHRVPDQKTWREARSGTFDAWLECHHTAIVELPDFLSMQFPGKDVTLRITLATQEAAKSVMNILEEVQLPGVREEAAKLVIVRKDGSDAATYVIQPQEDVQ